jgi:hypothetical protein
MAADRRRHDGTERLVKSEKSKNHATCFPLNAENRANLIGRQADKRR